MKQPFYLYKRTNPSGKQVWYATFINPDGTRGKSKNTGQTNKKSARAWAYEYLSANPPLNSRQTAFKAFSRDFFSIDGSWATDKKATGKRLSERQCMEKTIQLERYLVPHFGNMALEDITKAEIKEFRNKLYTRGVSGSTINKVLSNLYAILDDAVDREIIQGVPRVERVSQKPQNTRGILTLDEVRRLFSVEWWDFRSMVANMIACSTGLRQGEILALQLRDVHEKHIVISKSWEYKSRNLNPTTKTGRNRTIMVPEKVHETMNELADLNPQGYPESFLFYADKVKDAPMDPKIIRRALSKAMEKIGIENSEQRERNITFHSWRHWFNSLLINEKVPLQKVQQLTGHLSPEMSQHYYHLDDLLDVQEIQNKIF